MIPSMGLQPLVFAHAACKIDGETALGNRVQGMVDIVPNGFNVFNTDGEAQQSFTYAQTVFHFTAHAAVRLAGAVVNQAFHAAQARCHQQNFQGFDDAVGRFAGVLFQIHRHHAAKATHLAFGQFVVFMAF